MSTLVFLRKFTCRLVLGLSVLAVPNLIYAGETGGSQTETDTESTDGGGHGGHNHAVGNVTPGGAHINLQLSDETVSQLMSLLSSYNISTSCNNNPTSPLTTTGG